MMNNPIFPRALVTAAKTFRDRPKVVGEILVELVSISEGAAPSKTLSDVQRYVIAQCREELSDKERRLNLNRARQQRFKDRHRRTSK